MRHKSYDVGDIINLDALLSTIVQSDEFTTAVGEAKEDQIKGLVEDAVNEVDFSELIKNEMPSYDDDITDLSERIDKIEEEFNPDSFFESDAFSQAVYNCNKNDLECGFTDLLDTREFRRRVEDLAPVAVLENKLQEMEGEVFNLKSENSDLLSRLSAAEVNQTTLFLQIEELENRLNNTLFNRLKAWWENLRNFLAFRV